ncbi:ArnT family glycosyltransferase [Schlesneria paludicola]|uniref:ArnT family glycosyltransferase n=1 Tax=Schlesneria paludicola TaxID=360056 RepID=UPI00029B0CA9|nr:glycosyltransferase family 39 protein [Schlesneria paludicola]
MHIQPNNRLRRPTACRIPFTVLGLLLVHAGLLGYSASRFSPTYLESAFLVSGLAHWEFYRFEPYNVNPPLVRMTAALPVQALGYLSDWSSFFEIPGARTEFPMGEDFIAANGVAVIPLIVSARLVCIPFSLIGAYFAYRWARELYHPNAGLIALVLYIFDPNLLAHGALITPDAACIALGVVAGYTFWQWLRQPTWRQTLFAGMALGAAELTKTSWLILFVLWPTLWAVWRKLDPARSIASGAPQLPDSNSPGTPEPTERIVVIESGLRLEQPYHPCSGSKKTLGPPLMQLICILFSGIYLINLCYLFDGTGVALKDFEFVSASLKGNGSPDAAGNRFRGTCLGEMIVPLPKQFILGIDSQKKDFEQYTHPSYLRGEWNDRGWWYYYLYGLMVKSPCGTWGLLAFVVAVRLFQVNRPVPLRDEIVLLAPALVLMILVSSQSAFSIHLRYVFPMLGFVLIFIAQCGEYIRGWHLKTIVVLTALVQSVVSAMLVYPNHLSYFNEFVGGQRHGHEHLLGSSVDWGQGLQDAIDWIQLNAPSAEVEFMIRKTTLADVLWSHHKRVAVAPQESDPEKVPAKLILYSADYFSNRLQNGVTTGKLPVGETVVKRFPSGMVLVRCDE